MQNKIKKYNQILMALCFAFFIPSFSANATPPDFSQYPAGKERKTAFFNYFAPLIQQANQRILKQRQEVIERAKSPKNNQAWLLQTADDYGLKEFDPLKPQDIQALLQRIDTIPASLALAQAANESSWGTSRFAKLGNNYFGQWCFKKGCGLVPKQRNSGAAHEVRKFDHPFDSVKSYLHNLNSHWNYQGLRDIRAKLIQQKKPVTGISLAEGLANYSERKMEYVKELKAMIRYNKLQKYDTFK